MANYYKYFIYVFSCNNLKACSFKAVPFLMTRSKRLLILKGEASHKL